MIDDIFYTTKTVYVGGKITDDKGLYMDGGEHAVKCCEERLQKHSDIDYIILIPDNGVTNPLIIKRKNII